MRTVTLACPLATCGVLRLAIAVRVGFHVTPVSTRTNNHPEVPSANLRHLGFGSKLGHVFSEAVSCYSDFNPCSGTSLAGSVVRSCFCATIWKCATITVPCSLQARRGSEPICDRSCSATKEFPRSSETRTPRCSGFPIIRMSSTYSLCFDFALQRCHSQQQCPPQT